MTVVEFCPPPFAYPRPISRPQVFFSEAPAVLGCILMQERLAGGIQRFFVAMLPSPTRCVPAKEWSVMIGGGGEKPPNVIAERGPQKGGC